MSPTVPSAVFSERKWHLICRLSTAAWFLYLWVMCWHFLAIYHENEVSIYSWGVKKHDHEFLPHTAEPVCLCGAVQCEYNLFLLTHIHWLWSVKISWQWWCNRLKTVTNIRNLQVNAFPITVMFGMCSIFLFMAAILQRRLMVVADLHKLSTSMFHIFQHTWNNCVLCDRHINSVTLTSNYTAEAQEMTAEDEPLNP
jgi:hypothetical protein